MTVRKHKMADSYNRQILVVDDQPEILEDYLRILVPAHKDEDNELASLEANLFGRIDETAQTSSRIEYDYELVTASQGEEALSLVKRAVSGNAPFAVAFMDIRMPPGINGVEAAAKIRQIDQDIEIVFVTAYSDVPRDEILNMIGSVDKLLYLRKPFDADEIKQLALALTEKWNLNKTLKNKTEELIQTHTIAIRALAELAELRDTNTGTHLKRVAEYSKFIARELRKCEEPKWCKYVTDRYVEDLGQSSVLHDIGKVGIPDSILLKPGTLTEEEFELMKTHTTIGGEALAKADKESGIQSFLTLGKEIAYYHHERFDGTGYPKGLRGEDIPLSARIVALADVYDAITSDRPYVKASSHEKAFKIITEKLGTKHFDPIILEIFCNNEAEFKKIHDKYS